ncbi:SS18-like protein 2 isoform X1 [Talpa occidentalis]|uniref:SS18-like protein 2 isoform X1 n=1 Tax=Talpa occidentalis TaxID=50954 RepID=UPI0023F66507|nr:SS18-like protein 2 isoform X1 [Talpa occidentalis]
MRTRVSGARASPLSSLLLALTRVGLRSRPDLVRQEAAAWVHTPDRHQNDGGTGVDLEPVTWAPVLTPLRPGTKPPADRARSEPGNGPAGAGPAPEAGRPNQRRTWTPLRQ